MLIRCGGCHAALMHLMVTRPHEPETWRVRATCPWCGAGSFEHEVRGGFDPGGCGTPKEDDPSDDVPSTLVEDWDAEGGVVVFNVAKASRHARPIR